MFADGVVQATTLYVDSFGNIALNLTRADLERVGVAPGTRVELELSGRRYYAVAARTFADARAGDVILYEDSYANMSIAISNGNAAAMLHASSGEPLRIRIVVTSFAPAGLSVSRWQCARRRVTRASAERSPSPTSLRSRGSVARCRRADTF